jgi:hypothetical protein
MKYIKNFEEFVNESVNNNDVVIIAKTRSNKKYEYTRGEIQSFVDDINLDADDLPKWLYSFYMTLDSRSRNPHKTSKYAKQNVENKLKDLVKHKGKPEELDFNI